MLVYMKASKSLAARIWDTYVVAISMGAWLLLETPPDWHVTITCRNLEKSHFTGTIP